jgi:pantetheine-phosphate adenylyltransferase
MKKAVCPGSFDPITNGHIDIIKRAAELFDEVTVLVVTNPDKKCVFSPEERCLLIEKAVEGIEGVKVDSFSGLLADYVKQNGISAIVKGIRSSSDFEYEFQMALANRSLAPNAETVFITADPQNMYVSSSLIRQIAGFGGDVSDFVPKNIVSEIEKRLK